jgi:hypothetical protein
VARRVMQAFLVNQSVHQNTTTLRKGNHFVLLNVACMSRQRDIPAAEKG